MKVEMLADNLAAMFACSSSVEPGIRERILAALTLAQQEARAAALEEAAQRCEALSTTERGNDYGSIGGAFDEAADAIRALLEGK